MLHIVIEHIYTRADDIKLMKLCLSIQQIHIVFINWFNLLCKIASNSDFQNAVLYSVVYPRFESSYKRGFSSILPDLPGSLNTILLAALVLL